ncbi:MAG TPA: hypothetical protein VF125_05695 [Solirubrobacterales bacterium]
MAFLTPAATPTSSAAETSLRCQARTCPYGLSAGAFELEFGQDSIRCQGAQGAGRFTSSTASQLRLRWRNCREQTTPFAFTCVDMQGSSPRVQPRRLTATLASEGESGLEIANFKVSLACGGGIRSIIEGFVYLQIDSGACGESRRAYRVPAEFIGHGGRSIDTFFDVSVDGGDLGEYRFDDPWLLTFPYKASIAC